MEHDHQNEYQIADDRRKKPNHGIILKIERTPIIFLTVCTKDREPWLATAANHDLLRSVWSDASYWMLGKYVIMPDHIHLFVSPTETALSLEAWVRYWKSMFTRQHNNQAHRWQVDHWDTRMRSSSVYQQKWDYVRDNPVRKGLVEIAEDWQFQGEIYNL